MQGNGEILLVRHGTGRGRIGHYLWHVLKEIGRRDRKLARRIRLHYTGDPQPDLDSVQAVVFWLADPLKEHYPDCYGEAKAIADEAEARGLRVVNHPQALSHSIKSVQYRLWSESGIPTPQQQLFNTTEELRQLLNGGTYPMFIRSDQHHAQSNMALLTSADDAKRIPTLDNNPYLFPGTVTPMVDTREGYKMTAPGTPWADYYHKKRVLVCGDRVCPIHVYFSDEPMVGVQNSTFRARALNNGGGIRARLMARWKYDGSVRADRAFGLREAEFPELMRKAAKSLGLDFAAIDYSTFADGRPILWEANPYFVLPAWYQSVLPRERGLKRRYARIYETIRMFFRDLIEAPSSGS